MHEFRDRRAFLHEAQGVGVDLLQAVLLVIVNGSVTWGVVSTKLKYMDRDIEEGKRWREAHAEYHLNKGV